MSTQLHIPAPCHEKWSAMTPVRHDCRHCATCDRQIVDFTMKTDAQMLEYLHRNQGKICGKFRPDQLNRSLITPQAETVNRRSAWRMAASFTTLLMVQPSFAQKADTSDDIEQSASHNCRIPLKVITPTEDSIRTISGRITDAMGEPMAGVPIRVIGQENSWIRSGENGSFMFKVPLRLAQRGPLELEVAFDGFTQGVKLPATIAQEDLAIPIRQIESIELMGEIVRTKPEIVYRKLTPVEHIRSIIRKMFR